MMCGLMFPHKGSIRFDGIEVKRRLPETLEKIFLVPEEFDLPSISIDDYVRRNSVFYPNFNIDQFNQYLSDFELEHTKNLAKTSMGQKKKYLVSFALATNTPLLLMDEPTNGMDIPSKSQFRKVIASGMNEQKSIAISTHQVRDLENMIDHITILDNGLLLLDADTHTISSRLRFIKGGNESEIAGAFYKVSTIAGYSAILPNETDEESLIDIEMLFNCTIGDPDGQPFITSSGAQMLIWLGFFIYIAKSSSSLADQIGIRPKRVVYLTVPVSTAEKYIAHLLSIIVLYPLLFFAAIVVAQYASELISSTIRGEIFNPGTPLQGCFSMWKNSGFTTIFFVTSVLSTIATFTLGATLWQKNSFLKTVSALFLFSIVFSFSCSLFLTNEEIGSAVSYLFIGKFFDNSSNFFWLINTVQIAETTILGYIGYLRLKELEINETKR